MSSVGTPADAAIAKEGFFVTHFLTVRDQDESKDFLRPNSWRESDQG